MRWLRRRGKAEKVRSSAAQVPERKDEAEAALRRAEHTARKVDAQVDFSNRLRERWELVHERNNLAELFTRDYRRTHG